MTAGRTAALLVAFTLALGVAACGDDGGEETSGSASQATESPIDFSIQAWEPNLLGPFNGYATESEAVSAQDAAEKDGVTGTKVVSYDGQFHAIKDRPVLGSDDIVDPAAVPGPTGEPMLAFEFTPEGRRAFQELTRDAAQRGESFAIIVDDEVLSAPLVDPKEFPNGFDGRNGASLSVDSQEQAEELAQRLADAPDAPASP